jgi:hypothetical protein
VPETETTSNYNVGFSYNPATMPESTADFVFANVYRAFLEEAEVLEAQQINMELIPDARRIHIKSDSAGILALRIIDELENQAITS